MTYSRNVIDAHTLICYIEQNPRLGRAAARALDDRSCEIILPAIALAEASWIVEHGRCRIPAVADLMRDLDGDPRIALVPLDRTIIDIANTLQAVGEMHDRQIVATALYVSQSGPPVAVLTLDENIRASGLVPLIW